jgi:peroxiredoxin
MKKLSFIIVLAVLAGAGGWWLYKGQDGGGAPAAKVAEAPAGAPVVGAKAPLFVTKGALAGKPFDLDLSKQLEKGPLVLYFFPKVFSSGCTAEAHEFAERSADFAALGASVVGMSADDLDGLSKFSREACRDKFAVAQASPEIIKAYAVKMPDRDMTNRTSFVIGQDGLIKFVHSDLDYKDHVRLTYEAVQKLRAEGTT